MTDHAKAASDRERPDTAETEPDDARKPAPHSYWERLMTGVSPSNASGPEQELLSKLTPQSRARLLYEYCVSADKKVSETVHSLYIIAEHYSAEKPGELKRPEIINGIPPFFPSLTAGEKAEYCYNQVTEALSTEARPVTVESLRATKRREPDNPWSSYAGAFVRRVTGYVVISLLIMAGLYFLLYVHLDLFSTTNGGLSKQGVRLQWVAFGCLGALVHLLNHALTATRLQTFEVSEARKIGPRILLGGMFGFVVPWLLFTAGVPVYEQLPAGAVAAFFGGYSVRFSIGLLERLMAAILPETKPKG